MGRDGGAPCPPPPAPPFFRRWLGLASEASQRTAPSSPFPAPLTQIRLCQLLGAAGFRSERTGLGGLALVFLGPASPGLAAAPQRPPAGGAPGTARTEAGKEQRAVLMAWGVLVPSWALQPQAPRRPWPRGCLPGHLDDASPPSLGRASFLVPDGVPSPTLGPSLRASGRGSQHGHGGSRGGHGPPQSHTIPSATCASCRA